MAAVPYSALSTDEDDLRPRTQRRRSTSLPWKVHRGSSFVISDRMRTLSFYAGAVVLGIILHLTLYGRYSLRSKATNAIGPLLPFDVVDCPDSNPVINVAYTRPGVGQYVAPNEGRDLEELKAMVAKTKGYFTRDYSLWLGWNNMRYIIETAALHARLLQRTLVLPSFVYARACEWRQEVCAAYAPMVNRGDAMHIDEWRELPAKDQMGFKIPISVMLDLNAMRKFVPVITVEEYLLMHNKPTDIEYGNGVWAYDHYQPTDQTMFRIINDPKSNTTLFEPPGTVRVDRLPVDMPRNPIPKKGSRAHEIYKQLVGNVTMDGTIQPKDAQRLLMSMGIMPLEDRWTDDSLIAVMRTYGFGIVYTYFSREDKIQKTVVTPISEFAPYSWMRGLVDEYGSRTEKVVYLPYELHDRKKPGSLRFTQPFMRDSFTNIVLKGVVHPSPFGATADFLAEKMLELNNGRMWMAAHMRRGDFVRYGLTVEDDVIQNIDRIVEKLKSHANTTLQEVRLDLYEGQPELAKIPGVVADTTYLDRKLPLEGDRWYLATDERSPIALDYARYKGAVLINDLLSLPMLVQSNSGHPLTESPLRRLEGWPLLYTDVMSVLEQSVMARAALFTAQWRSSVAGGVLNLRGARGMDIRTNIIEGRTI